MTKIMHLMVASSLIATTYANVPTPCSQKTPAPAKECSAKIPTHKFDFGLDLFNNRIRTRDFHRLRGTSIGFSGDYTYTQDNAFFHSLEGALIYGKTGVHYDNGDEARQIHGNRTDLRYLFGKSFGCAKKTTSPYLGLGYRQTNTYNVNEPTKRNKVVGDTFAEMWYVPVGVKIYRDLCDRYGISGRVEASYIFSAHKEFKAPYDAPGIAGPVAQDVDYKGQRGFGVRADLALHRKELPFKGVHSISFGPFVNYWSLGKSNTRTLQNSAGASLATNRLNKDSTTEVGIKARVHF